MGGEVGAYSRAVCEPVVMPESCSFSFRFYDRQNRLLLKAQKNVK